MLVLTQGPGGLDMGSGVCKDLAFTIKRVAYRITVNAGIPDMPI